VEAGRSFVPLLFFADFPIVSPVAQAARKRPIGERNVTIARRRFLQAGATLAGAALAAPSSVLAQGSGGLEGRTAFPFLVKDVVYQQQGGKARLARVFQPAGTGPFPTILKIHGGGWNDKDRTDGQAVCMELVNSGILVVAIDFRNAGEAPYPAALQDINYAIRWLKHHAADYGGTLDRIGLYGTSSGGNLVLMTALRPNDPRYTAIPFPEAPDTDARVAFVISGWGVLYPEERIRIATATHDEEFLTKTNRFFPSQDLMRDGTPALIIEKGEKVATPPALVFQGDQDEWTMVPLAQRFVADYSKAGGTIDLEIYKGERHTFLEFFPNAPNSVKALAAIKAFAKKYGAA
jgi:acetyl esterase